MPATKAPQTPYTLAEWQQKPKGLVEGEPYDKYMYKRGESLESIASAVSRLWKQLSANELTLFNWGTAVAAEVNYYLQHHNGCTKEDSTKTRFVLSESDRCPFLWVPRIVPTPPSRRFRSPGQQDVGHVAPDMDVKSDADKHFNTLVIPATYHITLELGDIDGLYEPLPAHLGPEPWKLKGIQQRLQAIGCLYAPLGLSEARRNAAAKACWNYYKDLNARPDPDDPEKRTLPGNDDLKATLVREVRNNIVSIVGANHLTAKAEILRGGLPRSAAEHRGTDESAMIRLPGGYCYTWPRFHRATTFTAWFQAPNATDADRKYDYIYKADRFLCEKAYYEDNDLLGKIPLVARVWRYRPDGKWKPAEGVSVYFQLIDPIQPDQNPLRAPALRGVEMNFSKDSKLRKVRPAGAPTLTDAQWNHMQGWVDHAATIPLSADRATWVNANVNPAERRAWVLLAVQGDDPPYTLSNVGPKKFVDENSAAPSAPHPAATDPQRYNCPKQYGGKFGVPVCGETLPPAALGDPPTLVAGVFEVDKTRVGLHSTRDKDHADYGKFELAQAVTPSGEDHKHAVKGITNTEGYTGVIFAPARMGGDMYRIRAYVGPPSLEYNGADPAGPVMVTGTMTVWRNIRLSKYYRHAAPRNNAGALTADNDIRDLWGAAGAAKHSQGWETEWARAALYVTAAANVDLPRLRMSDAARRKTANDKKVVDANSYRPVDVDYESVAKVLRKGYCELILDVSAPENISSQQYERLIGDARRYANDANDLGVRVDWEKLLVANGTSPWLVTVRSVRDYNRRKGNTYPVLNSPANGTAQSKFDAVVSNVFRSIFESLWGDAPPPGLTILRADEDSNANLVWAHPDAASTYGCGGMGLGGGATLIAGDWTDREYAIEGVATHECGHNLFYVHAPPHPATTGGELARAHQDPGQCICIMSYRGCYGDFCGRCTLMLRGWHTKGPSCNTADAV